MASLRYHRSRYDITNIHCLGMTDNYRDSASFRHSVIRADLKEYARME